MDFKKPIVITDEFKEMIDNLQFPSFIKKMIKSKKFLPLVLAIVKKVVGESAKSFIGLLVQNFYLPTSVIANDKKAECIFDIRTIPGETRESLNEKIYKI